MDAPVTEAWGFAVPNIIKIALVAVAGIVLGAVLAVSLAVSGEDAGQAPITSFEFNNKKVLVFAPGDGPRTYVTATNAVEGQITVRNRRIVLKRDGSVLVDGRKLDLANFKLLEIYVLPDAKIETRVMKASS